MSSATTIAAFREYEVCVDRIVRRFCNLEPLDPADDYPITHDRADDMQSDIEECPMERAGALDNIADRDRSDDPADTACSVEQAAGQADRFFRRRVGNDGPSQRPEAFAKEGGTHDRNNHGICIRIVAQDDRGTQAKPDSNRYFPGKAEGARSAQQLVREKSGRDAADASENRRQGCHEPGLKHGKMPLLNQIARKP